LRSMSRSRPLSVPSSPPQCHSKTQQACPPCHRRRSKRSPACRTRLPARRFSSKQEPAAWVRSQSSGARASSTSLCPPPRRPRSTPSSSISVPRPPLITDPSTTTSTTANLLRRCSRHQHRKQRLELGEDGSETGNGLTTYVNLVLYNARSLLGLPSPGYSLVAVSSSSTQLTQSPEKPRGQDRQRRHRQQVRSPGCQKCVHVFGNWSCEQKGRHHNPRVVNRGSESITEYNETTITHNFTLLIASCYSSSRSASPPPH